MLPKIQIRKRLGMWWVIIPGDMPECARYYHWTDALARVQQELRGAYR